jgi:signal transduction histidine kinase
MMLATFIEALNEEIEPLLLSHGILLQQCLHTDLGEVRLHTNTFRHLWLNLIHNAIDAMPNGGELTIRAECADEEVRVTITDTGTGIAADQIPLLFVPFHTTKPDGTGLGLYVVQEVAAAHHGRVTVSSEMGVGTSFTLILPGWNAGERASEMK